MSSSIPTSTSVTESAVIQAPLSQVWHQIKLQDFHNFWTKLSKSEHVQGASPETDIVKWTFEDGTVLDVKLEEHSVDMRTAMDCLDFAVVVPFELAIDHYITYSVIASSPALTYSSVISTIRCYAVTSGEKEGSTFVQWSAHFSSDADAGVIEDARFKRKEALADLAKVVAKQ